MQRKIFSLLHLMALYRHQLHVRYQWFQIEMTIQIRPLKALGHVLFADQFSRLTHSMVLFINMVHVLQSVQDLINYPVICTLHQLSISQLMYSQLIGWAQSHWINSKIVAITSKKMQRFHTHPIVDFSNVFLRRLDLNVQHCFVQYWVQ